MYDIKTFSFYSKLTILQRKVYMNFFKIVCGMVLGSALLIPNSASAQEVTLRVEPGVAIPLTDPQAQRFNVGGALAVKPELGLGSYFSLGPSLSVLVLPSKVPGVDAGTAFGLGGFVRVKRPHDEKNKGRGWSAISPWVDADLQYVRTDPLDRFSWSMAVGASVPTSDSRQLWVGPFVRYNAVFQEDGKVGFNTNSAKTLILGVSFEIGAAASKDPEPAPAPPKKAPTPPPSDRDGDGTPDVSDRCPDVPGPKDNFGCPYPEPKPEAPQVVQFKQRVQFSLNSAELRPSENKALEEVTKALLDNVNYAVKVEGHACTLGTPEYNEKLSKRRADSVVDYLVSHGVARDRLTAAGFGSKSPMVSNDTEEGRVKNRRVGFDVTFTVTQH